MLKSKLRISSKAALFCGIGIMAITAVFIVTYLKVRPVGEECYKRIITIPKSNIEAELSNFPVLIKITDKAVFKYTKDYGEDIMFSDAGEVIALPFEIEKWDKRNHTGYIWVRVPLLSASTNTTICMFHNRPNMPENKGFKGYYPGSVWSQGYKMVMHLDETSGTEVYDSSPNAYYGAKLTEGEPLASSDGILNGVQSFDGKNDYISVPAAVLSDNPTYNRYTDTKYVNSTHWDRAQGLADAGTYFYYAGHHDPTKENADIHKIRKSDMTEVAAFSHSGPMHSAEVDLWETHDSLLACSGGNGRLPFVWEINKNTGEKIDAWDFAGLGENGGALVAWKDHDDIILFTSSDDGARIAFSHITLQPGGKYNVIKTWTYSVTDLGVPQGLDCIDGYIYYLADAGASVSKDPHIIYKISLNPTDNAIRIVEEYPISIAAETEGLTVSSDYNVYFGTAAEKIYKMDVTLNNLIPLTASGQNYTVSAWCKAKSVSGSESAIIGIGSVNKAMKKISIHLLSGEERKIQFGAMVDGKWMDADGNREVKPNIWYNVVGVYSGMQVKLYVNGVLAAAQSASGSLKGYETPLSIGAELEGDVLKNYFNGFIDEISISDVARSDGWISAAYRNIAVPEKFVQFGVQQRSEIPHLK